MPVSLKDGLTGDTARVLNNKLEVMAISRSEQADAIISDGLGWLIGSEGSAPLDVTNATENGILYVKNTSSDKTYAVDTAILNLGASTAGTGEWTIKLIKNPSAGTLISTATAANVSNRNFGEITLPVADAFRAGAVNLTVTNGDVHTFFLPSNTVFISLESNLVLPPGRSIAVTVTAPTGNTSAALTVSLGLFEVQN